jgi:aminoglycoside phosphotransferase (APT) family kinase protein
VASPARWAPERVISDDEALRIVSDDHPEFTGGRAAVLAEGWDNTAIRFTTNRLEAVFRFPRRQIALTGVRRELEWLPRLARRLPLPIPKPLWSGSWAMTSETEGGDAPWPYWGAQLIPGDELLLGAVPDSGRGPIAARLGDFLRILHATDTSDVEALPLDPLGRGHPARRTELTSDGLAELSKRGLNVPTADARSLLEAAAVLPPPPGPGVVCHGDLHARHVLIDPAGADASGIIDWGDLCRGDPAVDLSIAFAAFRGPARQALLTAYGSIDSERELRARALALFLGVRLTEYALDPAIAAGQALLPDAVTSLWRAIEA